MPFAAQGKLMDIMVPAECFWFGCLCHHLVALPQVETLISLKLKMLTLPSRRLEAGGIGRLLTYVVTSCSVSIDSQITCAELSWSLCVTHVPVVGGVAADAPIMASILAAHEQLTFYQQKVHIGNITGGSV